MGDINRDPSMEEILASIKRVISEETPPAPPPRARPSTAPIVEDEEDILELRESAVGEESLVSEGAASASRSKLAELAEMRRGETPAGNGPLEAAVREMLRPMLKQWLDERLPGIVEELVTREISRITGASL